MNNLQAIWTVLTTESEILTKIINIPLTIIEAILTMLLFLTILNITASKKQKVIYVSLFSLISIISFTFIPTPFNTFINIFACPILVYIIFKTNIFKSILAEVIPYVAFILVGSILINIYLLIFNISANTVLFVPIHKMFYSLLQYLFVFFIYLYCKHFNINISYMDKLHRKNTLILLGNLIIGIIALAIQSYLATIYADIIPISISIASVLILLICFLISMYGLSRTSQLESTTEKLEEEKLYNKTLTILYDNIRGFKHDFNNIVQVIGGYISANNMDGLKKYYSSLLTDSQKVKNLSMLSPELINDPAIYSLLTSKYHKAENLGVKMNIEIFLDLQTLKVNIYDLTRILGILLDNAIEASVECENKEINIIIRKDNRKNIQLFIIENTYEDKEINIDKIFEKGYTSKSKEDNQSHGLGLWEVREFLKKHNNLNLYTTKDNKYFKQQLEIYC